MKYATYDYEEPGGDWPNFWHIFSTDEDPDVLDGGSILYLVGPQTEELRAAVEGVCRAIDAAVDAAVRAKGRDA